MATAHGTPRRDAPREPAPQGVLVGAGSDPLVLGLPAVAIGLLTLGIYYSGFFTVSGLGTVVPVVMAMTGLFLLVATVWSIIVGLSLPAVVLGSVSGLALSLAALLLGVFHHWYAIPASGTVATEELFFIVWACLFLFLIVPCLRLAGAIAGAVGFVFVFLALAAAGTFEASPNVLMAAGAAALMVAFLGFYGFVSAALDATGFKGTPPLGKPLL